MDVSWPRLEGPVNWPGACGGYALCATEAQGLSLPYITSSIVPTDRELLDWAQSHRADLNLLPGTQFTERVSHWINPNGHDIVRLTTDQHFCPTKKAEHRSSTIYIQVNLSTMMAVTRCSSHRQLATGQSCCDIKLSKYYRVPGGKHAELEYTCPPWCNKRFKGKKKLCHMCKAEEDVSAMYAGVKPYGSWDGPIVTPEELLMSLRSEKEIHKRRKTDVAKMHEAGIRTDFGDLLSKLRVVTLGISQ